MSYTKRNHILNDCISCFKQNIFFLFYTKTQQTPLLLVLQRYKQHLFLFLQRQNTSCFTKTQTTLLHVLQDTHNIYSCFYKEPKHLTTSLRPKHITTSLKNQNTSIPVFFLHICFKCLKIMYD